MITLARSTRFALALILQCALITGARAQDGAQEGAQEDETVGRVLSELDALQRFERSPLSADTASAGLALASSWLLRGDWVPASGILQEVLELATERDEKTVASAARNLLAAVDRLCLRPAAGRSRWRAAHRLRPSDFEFERVVGVAARGNGELLIADDALNVVVMISESGDVDEVWKVAKVQRPSWGPQGEIRIETKTGRKELRGAASWPLLHFGDSEQLPAATARARMLDVAQDTAGHWLLLDREAGVLRLEPGGSEETRIPLPNLRRPAALAVDPLGNLYVLDRAARRVVVLDREGRILASLGPTLPGGLELGRPQDIAVDHAGRLFIVDTRQGVVVLE